MEEMGKRRWRGAETLLLQKEQGAPSYQRVTGQGIRAAAPLQSKEHCRAGGPYLVFSSCLLSFHPPGGCQDTQQGKHLVKEPAQL